MVRHFHSNQPHRIRKGCRFLLAFLWLSGILCGIVFYLSAGHSFFSLMRGVPFGAVSIVSLLYCGMFPFLISIFMVSCFQPVWVLPVCFCKAFLFSFVSIGVLVAFSSSGWLVRCLLLFSDCTSVILLYYLWLRQLSGWHAERRSELALILILLFLIASIDYRIISPFLGRLIDF